MNPLGQPRANTLLRLDMSPAVAARLEKARASSEPLVLTLGSTEKKPPDDSPGRTAQVGSIVFDSAAGAGAASRGSAGHREAFAIKFDDIGRYSI